MTQYREIRPHAVLAPYVRCLWELRTPAVEAGGGSVERVLPDGCCEWVFHLAQPFELVGPDGSRARQEAALFAGVTTRALALTPSPGADVLGVRFHPGGARAFQRAPLMELTDRIAPLAALELPGTAELAERLHDAPRAERTSVLQRALLARLEADTSAQARVRQAVDLLLAGRSSVRQVAADCGLGMRQLQRAFQIQVGVRPKELARIGRFQRVLSRLGDGRATLAEVALAAGYADQAHLGREFRALSGLTPARWRRESHALSDAFVAGGAPA